MMPEIQLQGERGKSKIAIVDDCDIEEVLKYKWYLHSNSKYATTTIHISGNKKIGVVQKNISMHRLIMNFPDSMVDHRNGNGLDNRRANLRLASAAQNCWNMKKRDNSTGYVGVTLNSGVSFCARLNDKVVGFYRTAIEAAYARDLQALAERGEFVVLNFSREELQSITPPTPLSRTGKKPNATGGVGFATNRKALKKWRVYYRKKHLGWFLTSEEALAHLESVRNENSLV